MKEIAASLQSRLWMTRASNRLSYLTLQSQGSFCKLITFSYSLHSSQIHWVTP